MNEELQLQINNLENEIADLRYILQRKSGSGSADIKGRIVAISTVPSSVIADDSIKQAKLDTEIVTLAFASGDTSKTATVTTSSIVIGFYASTVTGNPASASLQLAVSGTTLTGTLSAAPSGSAAITYTVVLLKL